MKTPLYNAQGKAEGEVTLSKAVFEVAMKPLVVSQVIVAKQAGARKPYAHTKDRSERRGGGRKPWQQKGTGRARAGSSRSPIWRKGGVTFGPRSERSFAKQINTKVQRQALAMVLSEKAADKKLVVVQSWFTGTKTKAAQAFLKPLPMFGKSTLVVYADQGKDLIKALRNMPRVAVVGATALDTAKVARYEYLMVTPEALKAIETHYFKK